MNQTELAERAMSCARRMASKRFRKWNDSEELIADAVSRAWEGAQTAGPGATPGTIAWHAVGRVGTPRRFTDAAMCVTHPRHGRIRRSADVFLDLGDERENPATIVQAKLDYLTWLLTLKPERRMMVILLFAGWRTSELAKRFKKSPGRISQIRDELLRSWFELVDG